MTVNLTEEQQQWLAAKVASGAFASIDEAVSRIIEKTMFEEEIANDDLLWAKPLVDEAIASIERGEFITLAEHLKRNEERMQRVDQNNSLKDG